MQQKPSGIWIEAAFLALCLMAGLAIAIVFVPVTAQPIIGTLRFEGLIEPSSAKQVTEILDEARRDPRVAAMVLEIDSYGGTATSSESIFQAMLQFRQEKPLVVVIDGAATSGGYFMAVAGSRLLATANSEVGNVGAWTMRPIDPQIYADVISTGPYKLTGGSRFDAINSLELTRDTFATSVVFQRQMSQINPLKITQKELMEGRSYLGAQAQALGLVDDLGGLSNGILAAAEDAGLRRYQVNDLPEYLGKPFVPTGVYFLAKLLQSSLPDTVFLLDSRVPAAVKAASQPAGVGVERLRDWPQGNASQGIWSLFGGGESR